MLFLWYVRLRGCFCSRPLLRQRQGQKKVLGSFKFNCFCHRLTNFTHIFRITSGLALSVKAHRRDSKLEAKPSNPKELVFSNFAKQELGVQLVSSASSTFQSIRRGTKQSARAGNKNSTRRYGKRSNPILLPENLLVNALIQHLPSIARKLGLDFPFSSSRLQNEVVSHPGLKASSTPLKLESTFSDLIFEKPNSLLGVKHRFMICILHAPPLKLLCWPQPFLNQLRKLNTKH